MAQHIEKSPVREPRRATLTSAAPGPELGLFATQTNRGDIQVVLRPAEDDPISLLTKPVRPPLEELEKELKTAGQGAGRQGHAEVRQKYRRRPVRAVMDEIRGRDQGAVRRAPAQDRTDPDHGGRVGRPVGREQAGRGQAVRPGPEELRRLAEQVGDMLEKKGKGRGVKEVNSNVHAGNPDLMVRVGQPRRRTTRAEARGGRRGSCGPCSWARSPPRCRNRRCASPTSASATPTPCASAPAASTPTCALGQWILLPESMPPGRPACRRAAGPAACPLCGRGRRDAGCARPTSSGARTSSRPSSSRPS